MGFLSDLATLLNAGLTVSDLRDLAKLDAQKLPAAQDPTPPADPPTPPDAPDPAPTPPDDSTILGAIEKLTATIQASNIINSGGNVPKPETVDDILAANLERLGGAPPNGNAT